MKKIRDFLDRQRDKFRRFVRSHPIQLVVLVGFLALLGAQVALAVSQWRTDQALAARVHALPKVALAKLSTMADQGKIQEVISQQIRGGTVLRPEEETWLEIVDSSGKHYAWQRTAAGLDPETFGKMLFEGGKKGNTKFSTGSTLTPLATDKLVSTGILLFCMLIFITFAQKMTGEILGGASFKPQHPDTKQTLDDVIGYDPVKQRLRELRDSLVHYDQALQQGVPPPKGILLTGGPGVGKTLMARCLANELGADFYTASGADFAEMYVGVGPRRVRSLFRMARLSRMAVIFIDEIDALGSRTTLGNDSERVNMLNAMLAEMDGINGNHRLVVIAATNAPDRLDPALRRPGRFDLEVHVPLPDTSTREGILRHHLKKRPVADNLDLRGLALRTPDYSGAELRGLVEEAARLAAREAKQAQERTALGEGTGGLMGALAFRAAAPTWHITNEHLRQAQEIARLGEMVPSAHPDDLARVAVHELGHALLGWLANPDIEIEKVTVVGRGQALGYAWTRPLEDRRLLDEHQAWGRLLMLLAGRAAEQVMLGGVSAGARDDLDKANQLVQSLVVDYGLGRLQEQWTVVDDSDLTRPVRWAVNGQQELTEVGQARVSRLLNLAWTVTCETIEQHQAWIQGHAEALLAQGTLTHTELFQGLPARVVPTRPGREQSADQRAWMAHLSHVAEATSTQARLQALSAEAATTSSTKDVLDTPARF